MTLEWDFWAKLLFFLGFVWWAIKWTARNLRAQIGPTMPTRSDVADLSGSHVESIVTHGLATRAQLLEMSAKERQLLSEAALALEMRATRTASPAVADSPAAAVTGARPPRTHCPKCGLLVENWPARIPWRVECAGCGSELVLRREGERVILNYLVIEAR